MFIYLTFTDKLTFLKNLLLRLESYGQFRCLLVCNGDVLVQSTYISKIVFYVLDTVCKVLPNVHEKLSNLVS